MIKTYDITILTDSRYINPPVLTDYIQNVLTEDRLLQNALEDKGLRTTRTNWDNPDFNWSSTRFILFRTTWDYFDRFDEFSIWLEKVNSVTQLINPKEIIYWNLDKHYLGELAEKEINIPPTIFIEKGEKRTLNEIATTIGWQKIILKPVISGAARHTYLFERDKVFEYESIFRKLIEVESLMIQEFQHQIIPKGEVAMMVFGGKFSHAILKKAKDGDFRVQDDFGGSVHDYIPSEEEITFCEEVIRSCQPLPVYARVDFFWDNSGKICLGELEMIEPELWLRNNQQSAHSFAQAIQTYINSIPTPRSF